MSTLEGWLLPTCRSGCRFREFWNCSVRAEAMIAGPGLVTMLDYEMNETEREMLAEDRAEAYAPKPVGGAFMAGVCGAALALLGFIVAARFYGWPVRDHIGLALILVAGGFVLVCGGYLRLARRNRRARRAERRLIDREQR
ncbi:hypothetical protein [Caulobacter radicis]|nr:hypothetical protein [Caulobacter radicis]